MVDQTDTSTLHICNIYSVTVWSFRTLGQSLHTKIPRTNYCTSNVNRRTDRRGIAIALSQIGWLGANDYISLHQWRRMYFHDHMIVQFTKCVSDSYMYICLDYMNFTNIAFCLTQQIPVNQITTNNIIAENKYVRCTYKYFLVINGRTDTGMLNLSKINNRNSFI